MSQQTKKLTGVARIWRATQYSIAGIKTGLRNETAFRQEMIMAAVMIPGAFWVSADSVERIILIGSVVCVLVVELLNSAIESTVDRISKEQSTLAGEAKDMASAAVFLSLLFSFCVWVVFLVKHFT